MVNGVISVILPCHNVAPYLKRCIDSILDNTYRNLQVICINDGSTDNTLEILESYSDERMTVISQKNKGLSLTRNIGIEKAQGEFICFIDSDDWVHKEYFEKLMETQKKTQADIVACKYLKTYEYCNDLEMSAYDIKTGIFFDTYDGSMLYDAVWGKLYRAEILGDTRFVDVFSEDKLFNSTLLISNKYALYATVDVELYYYFQRPGSLMNTFHEDRMLALAKEFLNISKKTDDPELSNSFVKRSFKLALSTRYMSMFRKNLESYRKSCDVFLKYVMTQMEDLPFSTRCLYSLFVKFPSLYRRYRKIMDSTMIEWEKKEIALHNV